MVPPPDSSKTVKLERYNSYIRRVNSTKLLNASSKLLFRTTLLIALVLVLFFTLNYPPLSGVTWEKQVRQFSNPGRPNGFSVLVTGISGFVGSHCFLAHKKRGDDILGLDNFNDYYDPSLQRACHSLLQKHQYQIFIVEGDLNDSPLLTKLFDVIPFTHVLHLAAQVATRE